MSTMAISRVPFRVIETAEKIVAAISVIPKLQRTQGENMVYEKALLTIALCALPQFTSEQLAGWQLASTGRAPCQPNPPPPEPTR